MTDKTPQPIKRMPGGLQRAIDALAKRIKKPSVAEVLAKKARKHLRLI